jgi:hypothetical protein
MVNGKKIKVVDGVAPHYSTISALDLGSTKSGLSGPVSLRME